MLVVGNPCNTNCLIAMNNGRDVPSDRWFAMTRLDENRAKTQLALKSDSHWRQVSNVAIWGNHSSTLYPDFFNARIDGKPATEVIDDREWLETTFIKACSSAARRSSRRADFPRPNRRRTARLNPSTQLSMRLQGRIGTAWRFVRTGAMESRKGLICSFPTRSDGSKISIVQDVALNDFAKAKVEASVNELKEERAMVSRAAAMAE